MRAGPLSNHEVIAVLNRFYVPVFLANEDYREGGNAPKEERAELERVFKEGHAAKASVGSVHVYLLAPDGRFLDSMHVADAARTEKLLPMLERVAKDLGTTAGGPVVAPAIQSQPPPHAPDNLLLHLVARGDNRGSWREFPSENWIVLTRDEAKGFLPVAQELKSGLSWEIDQTLARRLLTHFHPQTEDTSSKERNRIDEQSLKATLISHDGRIARARLDGALKMKRTFYPGKEDDKFVNATLLGFVDIDVPQRQLKSVRLITQQATYGKEGFGVALQSKQ